jgi:hypothetical protein
MDPLSETLQQITAALTRAGIRYAVGGSVASSARGVWRSTLDIDLIAAVRPDQAQSLATALGPDWYADPEMIREAIKAGRSFNVIQKRLAYKVDIFPATEEFHLAQLERAQSVLLGIEKIPCAVTSTEDILLAKLRWYREGGEVSERQWNDIVGLIATNVSLDRDYLQQWAARLRVTRLFEKALAEAQSEM